MKCFIFFLIVNIASTARSQPAEDSIKRVIDKMFLAMKNADANTLKSCFADSAILQTVKNTKEGKVTVENEPLNEFTDFVGQQKKGAADERINYESIKTDGQLAIAWTPYKFYYNGQFSHCGVNSFQLVRINGDWKIQYIIDTRRKKGCE